MTERAPVAAGIEFQASRRKRLHGLLIAGIFTVVGVGAILGDGSWLADGLMIGLVNLALAAAVVVYVARTAWNPGVGMVLDDRGLWFRDWDLPPVPWRHVGDITTVGIRLRPLICVELKDSDAFIAGLDEAARRRCRGNPLIRLPRLMVPNGALDAPLGDVVAAILEARAPAPDEP